MANTDKLRKQRERFPDIDTIYDENGDISLLGNTMAKVVESNQDYANTAQNVMTTQQRVNTAKKIYQEMSLRKDELVDRGDMNFEFTGSVFNKEFPAPTIPFVDDIPVVGKVSRGALNILPRTANFVTHDYLGNVRYKKKVFSAENIERTEMNSFMKMRFIYEPIKNAIINSEVPLGARFLEVGITSLGVLAVPGVGQSVRQDLAKINPFHRMALNPTKQPTWYTPWRYVTAPIHDVVHRHVEAKDASKGFYTVHSAAMTQTALAMDATMRMKKNPEKAESIYATFTSDLGALRSAFEAQKLPLKAIDAEQSKIVSRMIQSDPKARYYFNETYNGEVAPMCDITGEFAFKGGRVKRLHNGNFTLGRVIRDGNDKVKFVTQNGKPVFDLNGERRMERSEYCAPLTPCLDLTNSDKIAKERERILTKDAIFGDALSNGNFYVKNGAKLQTYDSLHLDEKQHLMLSHNKLSTTNSELLSDYEYNPNEFSDRLNSAFKSIDQKVMKYSTLGERLKEINKAIDEDKDVSDPYKSFANTIERRNLMKERDKIVEQMVDIHKSVGYALGVDRNEIKESSMRLKGDLKDNAFHKTSRYIFAINELMTMYNDAVNRGNTKDVEKYSQSLIDIYDNMSTTSDTYSEIKGWRQWSDKEIKEITPVYKETSSLFKPTELRVDPDAPQVEIPDDDEYDPDVIMNGDGQYNMADVPDEDIEDIPDQVDDDHINFGWDDVSNEHEKD